MTNNPGFDSTASQSSHQDDTTWDAIATASTLRASARHLAYQSSAAKNHALQCMAEALVDHQAAILEANQRDLEQAQQKTLSQAFIQRLALGESGILMMHDALLEVASLPDPIGATDQEWLRPNGLRVGKRRIPLGVIGIIYESRPNVTSDAAGLCLKSGNGVLLKGGSDAFFSNQAVFQALKDGIASSQLDSRAYQSIGFVDTRSRQAVKDFLSLDRYIDVIIPRGGKTLIDFVKNNTRIPIIKHDEGICHTVIDGTAHADDVDAIVLNAKVQRPGVCNAMETLLILENAVQPHASRVLQKLIDAGVKLYCCPQTFALLDGLNIPDAHYQLAEDEQFHTEYLSLELSVRIVANLDAAIEHIAHYSSQHTECLLTEDYSQTQQFMNEVDSSVIMINASSRFSDGNQLGLGAEIGISTTKMHAFGPMGLRELTTTKFVVMGQGQIRP